MPRRQDRTGSRRTAATLAGALVATAVPLAGGLPPAAADPLPPVTQPAGLERFAAYVPQSSCDPVTKPGVAAFRDLMRRAYVSGKPYGQDWGTARACNYGIVGEHKDGRAWDWQLDATKPEQKAVADRALGWLLRTGPRGAAENARRLGIMYIVWNGRIWGAYRAREGWRPGNPSDPHRDHIHFSFSWEGAQKRTSFWTGRVAGRDYGPCVATSGDPAVLYTGPRATTCPAPAPARYRVTRPRLTYGMTGADVRRAQTLLGVSPVGTFGPLTWAAVKAYQRAHRLPVTGALDATTWGTLDPASRVRPTPTTPPPAPAPTVVARRGSSGATVRAIQTKLGLPTSYRTGFFGSVTEAYVRDFQRAVRRPVTGVVDRATYAALTPRSTVTLRPGTRSAAVRSLQTALALPTARRTGYFGPLTRAAVQRYQRAHRLLVTGVADAPLRAWLRL